MRSFRLVSCSEYSVQCGQAEALYGGMAGFKIVLLKLVD